MNGKCLGWLLVLLFAATVVSAQPIMVPATAPTIQDGIEIAMAAGGGDVVVAPGVYVETVDISGGSITLRSSGGAAATTIDGGGISSALTLDSAINVEVEGFTISNGANTNGGGIKVEDSSGIAIRDCVVSGNAATGLSGRGGGIDLADSDTVLITNTVIQDNSASLGGGLGSVSSSFVLEGSQVVENEALLDGGGVYVQELFPGGFVPRATGSTIAGNSALRDGGGIAAIAALPLFEDLEIVDNDAGANGGGLYSRDGGVLLVVESVIARNTATTGGGLFADDHDLAVQLRNNQITDNQASGEGGGAYLRDISAGSTASTGSILGCTFSNNAAAAGGGVYAVDSRVGVTNSILWGNAGSPGTDLVCQAVTFADAEVGLDFSNLTPGGSVALGGADCLLGIGNIGLDPLFAAPATGDYHLDLASPCIDSGLDSSFLGDSDFEGDSRSIDGDLDGVETTDIGADESCGRVKGDVNGDGATNISDMVAVLAFLFQGGPAPSPLWAGDVNGDGAVGLADAVYLGAFLFQGGPAPLCRPF